MISQTLHQIHPATILPQALTGFNVYLSNAECDRPVKFLSSEKEVDESDCAQLRDSDGLKVFIDATSLGAYRDYLVTYSSRWLADDSLPNRLRSALLVECMFSQWQTSLCAMECNALVGSARNIAKRLITSTDCIEIKIPDLIHDLGTGVDLARHSFRTGIYCTLLGVALGYDRSLGVELCMGGLLHDIGKDPSLDPANTGPGANERMARSHPLNGFRRLCGYANVPMTVLMMCYQHHENVDGSGFPVRLTGEEIHIGARICAIVNRFDHLTSNENPRLAYSPGSAGRIMEQDRSNRFDQEMMKTWLRLLKSHLRNN